MKFDVCIMNPPWNTPLCYNIYNTVQKFCTYGVYIGPIQNIFNGLIKDNTEIDFSTSSVEVKNDLNEIFKIGSRTINGIVTWDKNSNTDITRYAKYWPSMSLFKKIKNKINVRLKDVLESNSTNDFSCRVFYGCKWDPKNGGAALEYEYSKMTNEVGHTKYVNCLNSEEERKNFWNTCVQSNFNKFLMKFTGINDIPYMSDYSKPWTDERFYKYFDLTKEEIKLIEDTIKDY